MKNFNEYIEKDLSEDFYQDEIDELTVSQLRRSFDKKTSMDYFKDLLMIGLNQRAIVKINH